jgi:hypothetical protein
MASPEDPWSLNYFNYFTEIEEHFRKTRGTGLFLLSTLDWALIESWKDSGVPLEAVLRGIELAFDKWRSSKRRGRMVNSLAFCAQAVIEEAERMAGGATAPATGSASAPFSLEEVEGHLRRVTEEVRTRNIPALGGVVEALEECIRNCETHYRDLEALEQKLSGLEDKMIAVARAAQSEQDAIETRAQLDRELRPYRGKMNAAQLTMLEKQYLDRVVLERAGLPRLSLFYLR